MYGSPRLAAASRPRRHPEKGLSAPTEPAAGRPPVIWTLEAEKPGDNAQIEAVANAIGLPWQRRRLAMRPEWRIAKPEIASDIGHLDLAAGDPLEPPWPDLIVTSGRRLFNAALWIKARSPGTKLVLVGRPHGHFEGCDLVIAAPQYRLPPRDNVFNLVLPLLFPDRKRIEVASADWRDELEAMKRPLTAVLVGAQTRPFRFGPRDARSMMRRIARATGGEGSLFVTTSRRTPPEVADAIAAALAPSDRLFRWQPEATRNPYLALLGLADRFVVTGDSASMMVEVARLGRPLALYELPPDLRPGRWRRHAKRALAGAIRTVMGDSEELLRRLRLAGNRDMTALHRRLYAAGRAVRLGRPWPAATQTGLDDEMAEVARRVRALLPES